MSWTRYIGGLDELRYGIDVRDPLVMSFKALDKAGDSPQARVRAVLATEAVFGTDLPRDQC